jgi:hypothetical protein
MEWQTSTRFRGRLSGRRDRSSRACAIPDKIALTVYLPPFDFIRFIRDATGVDASWLAEWFRGEVATRVFGGIVTAIGWVVIKLWRARHVTQSPDVSRTISTRQRRESDRRQRRLPF